MADFLSLVFQTIEQARRSHEANPLKNAGYVYLFRSGERHKIGRSAKPRKRYVQTAEPFERVCFIKTNDMYALEKELHARYAACRVHGEWFMLSPEQVAEIRAMAEETANPVKPLEPTPATEAGLPAPAHYLYFQTDTDGLIRIGHGPTMPAGAVGRWFALAQDAQQACSTWRGDFIEDHAGAGLFRPNPRLVEFVELCGQVTPGEAVF